MNPLNIDPFAVMCFIAILLDSTSISQAKKSDAQTKAAQAASKKQ